MPLKFTAELLVTSDAAKQYKDLLRRPDPDIGEGEVIFNEEVTFRNDFRMAIKVVASLNPAVKPGWSQGVLFDPWSCEIGCTPPGGTFLGEYIVYDHEDKYTVIVKEAVDTSQSQDDVNHPTHYCVNGLECIDIIEALDLNYHFSNAFKYLWRAGRKSDASKDIKKAVWYLNRWLEKNEDLN